MLEVKNQLEAALNTRKKNNAFRVLSPAQELIDFCSNDYLGLAQDQEMLHCFTDQVKSIGSGGSRLISGNSSFAEKLEKELAAFHNAPEGLLFNSGYVANLGLLSCVATRQDTIIYDQLIHASLRDGVRLSNARSFAFRHNDLQHLTQKLTQANGKIFIVVESVYSMDGDEAPLADLVNLAKTCNAAIIVDEAHATGVLGPQGKGLVAAYGLEKDIWARVHTFGKAIGSHGAIVLGDQSLKDYLINFSRPFIYTTAMPDILLYGIQAAYRKMAASSLTQDLQANIQLFKESISISISKRFIPSRSAIQSILIPGNDQVKTVAKTIQEAGFDVRPILHPTVAEGQERLRICIHAFNTKKDILALAALINQYFKA